MAGITNRGKFRSLEGRYRNASVPTVFYIALVTSATAPTADTNTFADLTEVAAGNGYTAGGISLSRNATDFDVLTEDDVNDRALVQLKDIVWTASGGTLPASGGGARYAILTTDEGTQSTRAIEAYFDLTSDRSVSSGQTLTLQNCEIRYNEA
jgi:hypothetical protein